MKIFGLCDNSDPSYVYTISTSYEDIKDWADLDVDLILVTTETPASTQYPLENSWSIYEGTLEADMFRTKDGELHDWIDDEFCDEVIVRTEYKEGKIIKQEVE